MKQTAANVLTWQAVDEPSELLLRDGGPGQVESDRLPLGDARQGLGAYGAAAAQVNAGPQALVTAPGDVARPNIQHQVPLPYLQLHAL